MRDMSASEFEREGRLLRENPQEYVDRISEFIRSDPNDASEYFSRHLGWLRLGHTERAMDDLNKALSLEENSNTLRSRGHLFQKIGEHARALQDFNRAEQLDPDQWNEVWGPLYQAQCHAALGDEHAALEACARLDDEHWSPGLHGAPGGTKEQVVTEIRRCLAERRGG